MTPPSQDGWTPLMWASRNGRTETVNVLLAAGANVDLQDKVIIIIVIIINLL